MTKKIKLYAMAYQDRSDRVRWLLEEMNLEYENVFLNKKNGELNSPEYRMLNPMGRVPTMVDQETVMFESIAIGMYLADKYSLGKLAPTLNDPERANYLQWMVWSTGSLECVIAKMFLDFKDDNEKITTHAYVEQQCKILSVPLTAILSKQDYVLKSGFSAADIMLGSILPGAHDFIIKGNIHLENYMNRLMNRPKAIEAKVF